MTLCGFSRVVPQRRLLRYGRWRHFPVDWAGPWRSLWEHLKRYEIGILHWCHMTLIASKLPPARLFVQSIVRTDKKESTSAPQASEGEFHRSPVVPSQTARKYSRAFPCRDVIMVKLVLCIHLCTVNGQHYHKVRYTRQNWKYIFRANTREERWRNAIETFPTLALC